MLVFPFYGHESKIGGAKTHTDVQREAEARSGGGPRSNFDLGTRIKQKYYVGFLSFGELLSKPTKAEQKGAAGPHKPHEAFQKNAKIYVLSFEFERAVILCHEFIFK